MSTWEHIRYGGWTSDMMAPPTVVIVVDDNAGVLRAWRAVARPRHPTADVCVRPRPCSKIATAWQTATGLLLTPPRGISQDSNCGAGLAHRGSKCPFISMTPTTNECTQQGRRWTPGASPLIWRKPSRESCVTGAIRERWPKLDVPR